LDTATVDFRIGEEMGWLKRFEDFAFKNYSCYLYENNLVKRNEAGFLPKILNINFCIVMTKQQVYDLQSAGFDLSDNVTETLAMLEQGAVVGFLFVDRELASMEWVAMNERANRAINIYPIKIDFSKKEAYASGVWTRPKFRGKGLHTYVYFKVYDFLRTNGITTVRSIVAIDNIAAQKAHEKFAPQEKIYARARYWRILGLQFWNEGPLNQPSNAGLLERFPSLPDR
jgi:ribosomal protein S18 acetylase RimI-like enzyme